MISVHHARELIAAHSAAPPPETVTLATAHGRILRETVSAPDDIPPFDRSAMDGYAIRADESSEQFEIIGEIRAGQADRIQLQPGQAIRIFTGAQLPGPHLKVVMQEHTEVRDQRLRILKRTTSTHIRPRGEDARAGEVLLRPGTQLDAKALALLASIGHTSVRVSTQPRILHLTTGDEIIPPEQTPSPGQIRNSNATLISALCLEQGVPVPTQLHAKDDLPAMVDLLSRADPARHDLILISGGSGSGDYDFSAELFRHLGATVHFREVNVRPGKPLIFGTAGPRLIFGLPGNVVSHLVCFQLFVRPALDHLLDRPAARPISAFLAESLADTDNARETWWPARATLNEGRLECRALPWKSSGDLTRLPAANSLFRVPAFTPQLSAETLVELLLTGSPGGLS